MTGFSADDVRGKTPRILKLGLQVPAFYKRLWAELMAGRSFQATIGNRRKTGEIYSVEETITLVDGLYGETLRFACNGAQKDDITSVIIKVCSAA